MQSLTHETLHSQSLTQLPPLHSHTMWGYYQGTEHLHIGTTDQGWKLQIRIVRAHPWRGGTKLGTSVKQPPFTLIDSIILESPDEVRFTLTPWKRTHDGAGKDFPHTLGIDATEDDIVARINDWLSFPTLTQFEELNWM